MANRGTLSALLKSLLSEPANDLRVQAIESLRALGGDTYAELAVEFQHAASNAAVQRVAAKALRVVATEAPDDTPSEVSSSRKPSRTAKAEERKRAAVTRAQKESQARAKTTGPLEQPVESLPGIGDFAGAQLRQRGIETVADAALVLPRRYDDERTITPLSELIAGTRQVTVGVVAQSRVVLGRRRLVEVTLEPLPEHRGGRAALLRLIWFRAHPSLVKKFERGARVRVAGLIEEFRGAYSISHPDAQVLDSDDAAVPLSIMPRYPEVPRVPQRTLARAFQHASILAERHWHDAIPENSLSALSLSKIGAALHALHHPPPTLSVEELESWNARATKHHERLAMEEFFVLELALHERREAESGVISEGLSPSDAQLQRARAAIPFALTSAQARVTSEIASDLRRARPMRRLLQGDVGSGKTAVAMLAIAHAVSAGGQAALMAPTEVLAEQHFRNMEPLAKAMGLRVAFLVGGARASHRKKVCKELVSGALDLIIGTHALLEDWVRFRKLRLVVVDEQHRFGVAQRLRLVEKVSEAEGKPVAPHLLVMTATPIPRTLALAVYGDLDVSVIDEMPPGRKPATTRAYPLEEREKALLQVQRALDAGGQAYVICPLVEESEEMDLRDATSTYAELSQRFVAEKVALLHGRQKSAEKEEALDAFSRGDVRVLVSTTVVEVGIDVPKANVILIEHAERFGLAQLHQLRGRVGRAGQSSACLLVHDARGEDARARIRTICETTDGFRIAEADLDIRGPGELFGRKQSGLPGFRFGDLRRDIALLERARELAHEIFERDPKLALPEHAGARRALRNLSHSERRVVKEEAG